PNFFMANLRVGKRITLSKTKAMTVSIQGTNIFNHTNPGLPVGNLGSPLFGKSDISAGDYGFGSNESGNRRFDALLHFSFLLRRLFTSMKAVKHKDKRTNGRRAAPARRFPAGCTVISRNDLSFARVLASSYVQHHAGARFYVLVVDRLPKGVDSGPGIQLIDP